MQLSQSFWLNQIQLRPSYPSIATYWWAFVDICLTLVLYLMQHFSMIQATPSTGALSHPALITGQPTASPFSIEVVLTEQTIEFNQEVIGQFAATSKKNYDLDPSGCIQPLLQRLQQVELERQTTYTQARPAYQRPLLHTSLRTPYYVVQQTLQTLACAGFPETAMITTE